MKIYFVGTNACGGANELASHLAKTVPTKCISVQIHFFFVAPVFHPFGHPFICPLILQHLRKP